MDIILRKVSHAIGVLQRSTTEYLEDLVYGHNRTTSTIVLICMGGVEAQLTRVDSKNYRTEQLE